MSLEVLAWLMAVYKVFHIVLKLMVLIFYFYCNYYTINLVVFNLYYYYLSSMRPDYWGMYLFCCCIASSLALALGERIVSCEGLDEDSAFYPWDDNRWPVVQQPWPCRCTKSDFRVGSMSVSIGDCFWWKRRERSATVTADNVRYIWQRDVTEAALCAATTVTWPPCLSQWQDTNRLLIQFLDVYFSNDWARQLCRKS